jgi:2-methylcitrate dehydratase PrpD
MVNITDQICQFALDTKLQDIPGEVIRIAKEFVLDSVGATLIGSLETISRISRKYVEENGGKPDSGVIGGGFRTSANNAAFLNGISNHAPELEACADFAGGNPVSVIPVALALGEKTKLSGGRILEAIIVGFEVQGKMGLGTTPASHNKGWCSIALHGSIGAAVTAAKLLDLNSDQFKMALGIAADQASGLMRQVGTMAHLMEGGFGCRNGMLAAELAGMGATATNDIFDGSPSFWETYVGEGDFDPEKMIANLGDPFYFLSPGISMKKYPCCFFMHRGLDAVLSLIKENSISYEDVDYVEAGITPFLYKNLGSHGDLKSGDMARFSLEHCLAAAILRKEVDVKSFTDEIVQSREFLEAREKIRLTVHSEWASGRSALVIPISIMLKNGEHFTKRVEKVKGSAELPLDREEQLERYRALALPVLGEAQINESADMILELEERGGITDLMNILTFGRSR